MRFLVYKANDETRIILAHKFVLSVSSPMFENTFCSEDLAAADVDSAKLRGCDNDSFLEILPFRRSDEAEEVGHGLKGTMPLANHEHSFIVVMKSAWRASRKK